jgi:uncharacterized lipoprotein YddW (UPF0748 family)
MSLHLRSWLCLTLLLGAHFAMGAGAVDYVPSQIKPPAAPREFRGLWLATVKNIDWPSRPGLTTAQQKVELVALLDQAKRLRLNAVFLQIRPSCDALYASKFEPWSEFLTGRMGRAPQPFYDPLTFAVEQAHQRGLELHAWFNPYRARHTASISPPSADHISKTRPDLVRPYGSSLWLDPGDREVQEHSLNVVLDVVQRYDVDGVHFDDYFYPYPEKDKTGRVLVFPDWRGWQRYRDGGGKLDRESWRRENVNLFVLRVSQSVRKVKPWVKFGIAPFGIWRPGHPPQIKGLDAYDALYADARKWWREGWVDYLAPQLYWSDEPRETSFSALLQWWAGENIRHRHLWPGLDVSRVGPNRPAEEIINQIKLTRKQSGASGNMLWAVRALTENRRGISDALLNQVYTQPALSPAFPWLDNRPPAKPQVSSSAGPAGEVIVNWLAGSTEPVWLWLVQTRTGGAWATDIVPGSQTGRVFMVQTKPEIVAITALDRCGNAGLPAVLERRAVPGAKPSS